MVGPQILQLVAERPGELIPVTKEGIARPQISHAETGERFKGFDRFPSFPGHFPPQLSCSPLPRSLAITTDWGSTSLPFDQSGSLSPLRVWIDHPQLRNHWSRFHHTSPSWYFRTFSASCSGD